MPIPVDPDLDLLALVDEDFAELFAPASPGSSDVYLTFSDDYGRTWATETIVITDAHRPTVNFSLHDGLGVVAALRYVSGSSGPCHIVAVRQRAGDASFGSEYLLQDGSGDLVVDDDSFHLCPAHDVTSPWVLVAVDGGEVKEWVSYDRCLTWALVA